MAPADPSPWNTPEMVAGFAQSAPNVVLMRFAEREFARSPRGRVLDIGCGAGRNALPLAALGWDVVGIDLSRPMLDAAVRRARAGTTACRFHGLVARMEEITFPPTAEPVPGETFVFTQFSGEPQCFLTHDQLVGELDSVGFVPDPGVPLTEYNVPKPGMLPGGSGPVIYEAAFRLRA